MDSFSSETEHLEGEAYTLAVTMALRQSEERYRHLISVMPTAMYTCDAQGLITYYNRSAAEIWGREPKLQNPEDKFCGSFHLYLPDLTPMPHEQCPMAEAVLGGIPSRNKEILIERPDGVFISATVNIDPLYDENDNLTGAINVFQDITEQKRWMEKNRLYEKELEERIAERTRKLIRLNRELVKEIEERTHIEAELEELQRRLMDRVEAERLAIAREIHDGPIQDLYALMYRFALVTGSDEQDGQKDPAFESIRKDFDRIVQSLRLITRSLRPATLSPFGLEKSIREHAGDLQNLNPELAIELDLMPDQHRLPESMRLALFRIYQVGMTNIIRHAHASQVRIRFDILEDNVVLEIKDNGRGFELPKRWIELARAGHMGLIGSKERAESIGGKLWVETQPGQGTRLQVTAPLRPEA